MFLPSLSSMTSGLGFGTTNQEEERYPPPQPTPVTFPEGQGSLAVEWDDLPPDFQSLFSKILRPTDVTHQHLEALNLTPLQICSIDDLLPPASDGTSYLPPSATEQAATTASYAQATRSDPVVAKRRRDFEERLMELRVDNDTAFRILTRTNKPGVKPPRLAYMRKFWAGLENMSQYWDCSLDQYYEVVGPSDEARTSPKRQRLEGRDSAGGNSTMSLAVTAEQVDADLRRFQAITQRGSQDMEPTEPSAQDASGEHKAQNSFDIPTQTDRATRSPSASPEPEPRPRMRYKGRRTSTGREMSNEFRSETVRAFVEGTVWPFQSSIAAPRQMPIVQFGKLNLPVRRNAAVYRMPQDRMRARQGILEGPMITVQVRPDVEFTDADGQSLNDKSRMDFMREIGGLLQLAQERRRQGRMPEKPGEGKWWTTTPRWGGGPGGEVENEDGNSDIVQAAEGLLDGMRDRSDGNAGRSRKKKAPTLLWKELKCGSGHWDPKTDYIAIGKPADSSYDTVFMVSSLNHHVSILKLTVHEAYTDYLTFGTAPNSIPVDKEWCKPRLQRTQWFDLFDMEQRVAAFRGLWGIMAYLTREADDRKASE